MVFERKSRILYIKRFLKEQTDEANPAAAADIIAYLNEHGITAARKTVAQDIELLIEAGVDVICNKSRQNQYFIGDRHFELPELKLLIEAAQASKFLTAKRSRSLIDKLLTFASLQQRNDLSAGLYFDAKVKPKNETAYIAADMLHTAISMKLRVRFKYFEYNLNKKKVYKHGQRIYEFSPWHFVWNDDKYYVIGHSKHHGKAVTFRVDRIATPKLTELEAMPAPEGFDLAAFTKSVFQMYEGPMLDVTLKCKNDWMKTIIDRFGEDVHTFPADMEHFHAKVCVSASKTFYGWIFASDGAVRITAPAEAVQAYGEMLARACER